MVSVNKKCGVYKIVCRGNGLAYYGSTVDWVNRQATHKWSARKKIHHSPRFQHCWDKYGEDQFDFIWLQDVPVDKLRDVEQIYLDLPEEKLNIAKSAEHARIGTKHTDEWCRNHSAQMTGRKWSDERKATFVSPMIGRKRPRNLVERLAAATRESGRMRGENNYFYNNPRPPEQYKVQAIRKQLKSQGYFWQESSQRWRVSWSFGNGSRKSWMVKTEQEAVAKVNKLKQDLIESCIALGGIFRETVEAI